MDEAYCLMNNVIKRYMLSCTMGCHRMISTQNGNEDLLLEHISIAIWRFISPEFLPKKKMMATYIWNKTKENSHIIMRLNE